MATRVAKERNAAPPVTKICSKCKQTKQLSNYYSNRDWTEQLGKDVWCKDCAQKCVTKDELRAYFWENNREWDEKLWTSSRKKAELAANKKPAYQKALPATQKNVLDRLTCQNVLKSMQLKYKFVDHTNDINVQTYEEAKEAGHITAEEKEQDPNIKTYSEEFGGYFKPDELKFLEDYYNQLENDFELNDVNLRDTAKKLAKASLQADRVQDRYMAGQATMQDVKDAVALFDLLSKAGNFSASKRRPEEKPDENSFSQIAAYCETHGHPCIKKIDWDKDIIDGCIDSLYYLAESLRDENEGEAV